MEININLEGEPAVIKINGNIDEAGAEELKKVIATIDPDKINEVSIDLGGVETMGSSAIGKLLLFYKKLAVSNSRLRVENLAPHLFELFCELKLDTLFTITRR